jgi:PPP family 3-phenylpropionic acid transporter
MSSPLFSKLSAGYFWYFSILGMVVPFLPIYLDSKGFSSLQIGEILAIVTATKIIGPTLWAMLADKSGKQITIIRLGALLALICFSLLFFVEHYWPITFVLAIFSLFWTAILPQLEVLTLNSVRRNAKIYARIRLWGSIGFIALAIITGELIAQFHAQAFTFIGLFILLALLLSTLLLKQPKTSVTHLRVASSLMSKICAPGFILFFLSGLLLQVSFGPYYSFFALFLRDLAYPGYAVGFFISVAVVAEIMIFIFAGTLFKYFSIRSLMAMSLFITAIRWLLTAYYAGNAVALGAIQLMHAASFGVYHSASILFVQQHFDRHQQNRGQAIFQSGVYGIGGAIGAYCAGLLWLDGKGAIDTFELAAYSAFMATFLSFFITVNKPKVVKLS